jgi:hypothetical protein
VIVDLKGFAITGPGPWELGGDTLGIVIGSDASGVTNPYPITVRNGTINNFAIGIESTTPFNLATVKLSNITIDNIVFNLPLAITTEGTAFSAEGINFNYTSSSIVSNCTFNTTSDLSVGIVDHFSTGGNSYNNNTFSNILIPISVEQLAPSQAASHLVLNSCQFAPPPPPTLNPR